MGARKLVRLPNRNYIRICRIPDRIPFPHRRYIGLTDDLERRLAEHERGIVEATAKNRPWDMVLSLTFADEDRARAFEAYLKTGSGRAFAERHFW